MQLLVKIIRHIIVTEQNYTARLWETAKETSLKDQETEAFSEVRE